MLPAAQPIGGGAETTVAVAVANVSARSSLRPTAGSAPRQPDEQREIRPGIMPSRINDSQDRIRQSSHAGRTSRQATPSSSRPKAVRHRHAGRARTPNRATAQQAGHDGHEREGHRGHKGNPAQAARNLRRLVRVRRHRDRQQEHRGRRGWAGATRQGRFASCGPRRRTTPDPANVRPVGSP